MATKSKPMTAEAKKVRAAYMRQWRATHPGKQKEYTEKMWQNRAEKMKAEAAAAEATA